MAQEKGTLEDEIKRNLKRPREDATDPFASFPDLVQAKLRALVADGLITPRDFDEPALEGLARHTPEHAAHVLDTFREAAPKDIRNKAAYLCSLMKKQRVGDGRGNSKPCAVALETLSRVDPTGKQLDEGCLEKLASVPVHVQIAVTQELDRRGLAEARNPSAFFIGLIKKHSQSGGGGMPAAGPAHGGHHPAASGGHGTGYGVEYSVAGGAGGGNYGAAGGAGGGWNSGGAVYQNSGGGGVQQQYAGGAGNQYGGGAQPVAAPVLDSAALSSLAGAFGAGGYGGPPGGIALPAPLQPPQRQQRKHYGLEQVDWGVRVDEFHQLSSFAPFVHPAVAMKLQTLWDSGNRLLSLLDDASWEAMSKLGAQDGVASLRITEQALKGMTPDVYNVNSSFMAAASKYLGGPAPAGQMQRADAATSMPHVSGGMQGYPGPLQQQYQQPQGAAPAAVFGGQPQQQQLAGTPGGMYNAGSYGGGGGQQGSWQQSGGGSGESLLLLDANVRAAVQATINSSGRNGLRAEFFDGGVQRALAGLSPPELAAKLTEIGNIDFATVKKPGGYIMGILRKRK